MTNDSLFTRRQMVQLTGATAVAGLAGCTGTQTNEGQTESEMDGDQTEEDHEDEELEHEEEEEGEHEEEDEHGGEDEHGHDHDEGELEEPTATAEVKLQTEGGQHHFAPHAVWIEPGGTVTWTNESGQHDAVAYHPDNGDKPRRIPEKAAPWSTGLLAEEGAAASHTFETEGVYDYYCTPHESVGMVGTVVVGEPDPHDQPALEEPESSLPDGAKSELADLGEKVDEALGHTH
ncbi:MAG: plastocyanin/azurin family copper-binding protein [Natronomonas sp.]